MRPKMSRPRPVRAVYWAAFLAAVAVGEAALAGEGRQAEKPNVILVLTDDQGYGDLACHGNPILKTPFIDKLSSQSIRFTDFHVAPMCTPTRGELLTGRDALANGAYCVCSGRTFMRQALPTMADLFAASGYRTGIFGKWHLGDSYPHRPQDRGFHEAVYHLGWGITSTPDYWNNDYFDDTFRHNGRLKRYPGYCTDVWFAEAKRWIRECRNQNQPFFAYISTNAPHGPFWVPGKYREPYKDLDRDTSGFFGMIANIDENMAGLDAMLEETGLRRNTILIFMTDNGGTGGIRVYNAGMRGAKASLYEGGHRVPCFIRWPAGGLRAPCAIRALTHGQDVLPTLMDLCGLSKPEGARLDGVSLARLLKGRQQPELADRMLVVQYGGLERADPQKWDATVMWNRWRLVTGKELYDIQADPGQKNDVAADHPDILGKMRDHYQAWWAGVEPGLTEFETSTLGSDHENPTRLSSLDWLAPKLTIAAQTVDIRLLGQMPVKEGSLPMGRPTPVLNGPWNVLVQRDGLYEIALRRWPNEADTAITAPLPPYHGVDGMFPEGKALPAAKARVRIGPVDVSKPVAAEDKAATFSVRLSAGKTRLDTWFYDAEGNELCGAFYVSVRRLAEDLKRARTDLGDGDFPGGNCRPVGAAQSPRTLLPRPSLSGDAACAPTLPITGP
jgi:arylsulfatase A-like enzyme